MASFRIYVQCCMTKRRKYHKMIYLHLGEKESTFWKCSHSSSASTWTLVKPSNERSISWLNLCWYNILRLHRFFCFPSQASNTSTINVSRAGSSSSSRGNDQVLGRRRRRFIQIDEQSLTQINQGGSIKLGQEL
jgi:hypothetical protein